MRTRVGIPRALLAAGTVACMLVGAWAGGLIVFAATMAATVEDRDTATDAVVVLTGGSERLAGGLALLEQGKGRKLLVSGVHKGVDLAELLRRAGRPPADTHCCIALGHAADDTVGNAAETAAWMAEEHFASLRLVTASYHMQRAMLEFRRAMPGVLIVAHPVFPDAFKKDQWWRWPGTAHLLATEYTKYLGALARPLFIPKPPERKP
ncbi:YdcF family protein [Paramagnetospirillum kuznetsovii]|uniref:YdcF family protein n=1 Tax=Paramagnetospirillum kuznetsovii TaxID=2053833 RepID=A0A364P0Y5_9PROT|nr:YdcF family protein [Paramagnetospirillum kuznetsovii]RAU22817.1 YdcF family protein [Paramagnetospirillum kuznetsovii]